MSRMSSPMNARRSEHIRAELVARAARDAPPGEWAGGRRGAMWGRPVARRAGLGLAATAAVAVAASAMVGADPTARPGYADWVAVPQAAPSAAAVDMVKEWDAHCGELAPVTTRSHPGRPEPGPGRKVLVDRRGEHAYCVELRGTDGPDPGRLVATLGLISTQTDGSTGYAVIPSDDPARAVGGGDVVVFFGDRRRLPPLADALRRSPQVQLEDPPADVPPFYQLVGLAGPEVTGVEIVLANGLRVTATLRDGVWGAWWPADKGEPGDSRIEVRTAAGSKTVVTDTVRLRLG